jgi:magnesium-protoporphyrin IX monomethyl ester (oxidative) cyclase
MHVRDHQRPLFHAALGVDPDWYGQEVFRKTSEISKQVFPITLDIDHPRWMPGLRRLRKASADIDRAKKQGGIGGALAKAWGTARAMAAFLSLLTIPAKKHQVPASTRLDPAY